MFIKFHSYHSFEAHFKAFVKLFFLLLLALIPQAINLLLVTFGVITSENFLNLNDALIYSFSFIPPAIFMTWDILDDMRNDDDHSSETSLIRKEIASSYKWIFFVAILVLVANVILYSLQIALTSVDSTLVLANKIPVWVTYTTFGVAVYIWYTTLLYNYFDYSNHDFNETTKTEVDKKIGAFKSRIGA